MTNSESSQPETAVGKQIHSWARHVNDLLSARSTDIGNTMGIDMGNSFHFTSWPFQGHVLERNLLCGATTAVCEVGFEGPTKHVAIVSSLWTESSEWLQMEGAIRTGRTCWTARSNLSSAPIPAANLGSMAASDPAVATETSKLGRQETCRSIEQVVSASKPSGCTHDWQVAQANEAEPPRSSAFSARSVAEPKWTDGAQAKQSGLDGRFQGLVSNSKRMPGRALDGSRFVQSLPAGSMLVGRSKLAAGSSSISAAVSAVRLSPNHPRGQWRTVRIDRASGAFALERMVDGHGSRGPIHSSGASGTEWSARTNASGVQSRNDTTLVVQCASAAAADPAMGQKLQPGSTPRGFGAAAAKGSLSTQRLVASTQDSSKKPTRNGEAPGAKQWPDQMARAQTFCGGSLRRIPCGTEVLEQDEMAGSFCRTADWGTVGIRSGWNAARSISAPVLSLLVCLVGWGIRQREPKRAQRLGVHSAAARCARLRYVNPKALSASHRYCHEQESSSVTNVCAQSVTNVCARCPPQPSPPKEERETASAAAVTQTQWQYSAPSLPTQRPVWWGEASDEP